MSCCGPGCCWNGSCPPRPRVLDIGGASGVDASWLSGRGYQVHLIGPLYHVADRTDRVGALAEARRVTRPGGIAAAR